MTETGGNRFWFELARVQVIGSQLSSVYEKLSRVFSVAGSRFEEK